MFSKKTYLFILIFISIIIYSYAQDTNTATIKEEEQDYLIAAEGLVISKITIEKPKRTKLNYIKLITIMKEGDIYTKNLHIKTYLRLWKTNIFSSISISPTILKDNTVSISIVVKDKWTLIPAPIFSISADKTEGGIALLESNLLGYNKTLVLVGIYGTNRALINLIYSDPELFHTNFELSFVNFVNFSQYTDTTYGIASVYNVENSNVNTVIRKTQGLNYSTYFTLGYKLPDIFTPFLSIRFNMFNNEIMFDNTYTPTENQLDSSMYVSLYGGIKYNNRKPYGIVSSGLSTSLQYTLPIYTSSGFYQAIIGDVDYVIGLDKKQINIINLNSEFTYGNSPLILQSGIGGGNTAQTISSNSIRTNKFISSAASHEIIVYKNTWGGIITGYGGNISIYEVTAKDGQGAYAGSSSPKSNYGIFANIGLRINQVAIPLAKFTLGYNITGQYLSTSFSIGSR